MKIRGLIALSVLVLFSCSGQKIGPEEDKKETFLFNKAIIFYLRRDFNSAEKGFLEIVQKYPSYTPAYIMLGKSYFFMNRFGEAEKYFKQSIDKSPNVDSYIWLSKIAIANTNMNQCLEYLNKALQLDMSSPLTHYELGKYYRMAGQYDKAIYNLNYAISYEDIYPEMKSELASLYMDLGAKDKADKLYGEILKSSDVSPMVRSNVIEKMDKQDKSRKTK